MSNNTNLPSNRPFINQIITTSNLMKSKEEIKYWVFSSYKNENDFENNQPFFEKKFTDFNKMKMFSANHSYKNRIKYPEYCSNYKKINSLNKQD